MLSPGDLGVSVRGEVGGAADAALGEQTTVGQRIDLRLLLACSAWLIFNSHLEQYYPRSYFAADGLLGNAMFFVLSGYGIQSSLLRPQSFLHFARRRVVRLYPPVWIATLVLVWLVGAHWRDWGWLDYPRQFIWPTQYGYIKGIVPFYLLLYVIGSQRRLWPYVVMGLAAAALYVVTVTIAVRSVTPGTRLSMGSQSGLIYWAYFWLAVSLGAVLALLHARPVFRRRRVGMLLLLLAAYFGLKFVMVVMGHLASAFFLLHLLVLAICGLSVLTLAQSSVVERLVRVPLLGAFMALSAMLTLEIYVTHQPMVHYQLFLARPFPLNILCLAAATVAISWLIHRFSTGIARRVLKSDSH